MALDPSEAGSGWLDRRDPPEPDPWQVPLVAPEELPPASVPSPMLDGGASTLTPMEWLGHLAKDSDRVERVGRAVSEQVHGAAENDSAKSVAQRMERHFKFMEIFRKVADPKASTASLVELAKEILKRAYEPITPPPDYTEQVMQAIDKMGQPVAAPIRATYADTNQASTMFGLGHALSSLLSGRSLDTSLELLADPLRRENLRREQQYAVDQENAKSLREAMAQQINFLSQLQAQGEARYGAAQQRQMQFALAGYELMGKAADIEAQWGMVDWQAVMALYNKEVDAELKRFASQIPKHLQSLWDTFNKKTGDLDRGEQIVAGNALLAAFSSGPDARPDLAATVAMQLQALQALGPGTKERVRLASISIAEARTGLIEAQTKVANWSIDFDKKNLGIKRQELQIMLANSQTALRRVMAYEKLGALGIELGWANLGLDEEKFWAEMDGDNRLLDDMKAMGSVLGSVSTALSAAQMQFTELLNKKGPQDEEAVEDAYNVMKELGELQGVLQGSVRQGWEGIKSLRGKDEGTMRKRGAAIQFAPGDLEGLGMPPSTAEVLRRMIQSVGPPGGNP